MNYDDEYYDDKINKIINMKYISKQNWQKNQTYKINVKSKVEDAQTVK